MKKALWTLIFVFCLSTPALAKKPSAESVQQLMTLTGADQMANQFMEQMLPNMKQMAPEVPESFWNEFMAQVDTKALIKELIPIYQKHLDQKTVDALITFFKSDAGQAFIKAQPGIMGESMQVGQAWGQALAVKIATALQNRK